MNEKILFEDENYLIKKAGTPAEHDLLTFDKNQDGWVHDNYGTLHLITQLKAKDKEIAELKKEKGLNHKDTQEYCIEKIIKIESLEIENKRFKNQLSQYYEIKEVLKKHNVRYWSTESLIKELDTCLTKGFNPDIEIHLQDILRSSEKLKMFIKEVQSA